MLESVARTLIVGDVTAYQGIGVIGGELMAKAQGVVMPADTLARTQDRKLLAIKQAKMLIVAYQRPPGRVPSRSTLRPKKVDV